MKKALFLALALCVFTSIAFAQPAQTPAPVAPAAQDAVITVKGDIIDNMCAGIKKPEELAAFVKTHTKECALMPNCQESGYSIFADNMLYKFDKESNAKVVEFLKKADSKLQVVVTAKQAADGLSLVSIEVQK